MGVLDDYAPQRIDVELLTKQLATLLNVIAFFDEPENAPLDLMMWDRDEEEQAKAEALCFDLLGIYQLCKHLIAHAQKSEGTE